MNNAKVVKNVKTAPRKVNSDKDVRLLFERLKKGSERNDVLKKSMIVADLRLKHDLTPEEISEKSHISNAHVYNYLKIDSMPAKVKQLIKEGRIKATDALKLARKQRTKKSFIDIVVKYIKQNESVSTPIDASIMRKEQSFLQNQNIDSKLKTQIEKMLNVVVPNLSVYKKRMCTNLIAKTINGIA